MLGQWDKLLLPKTVSLAKGLFDKTAKERKSGKIIYPKQENIFRALEATPPQKVKVVIVGQDPYHEPGQACGLAFSVPEEVRLPPSLRNIYSELCTDIGCPPLVSGDLSDWAEQGVLLLNTVLTVEDGKANSHVGWGWQKITSAVLDACKRLPQPIVYILWGKQAIDLVSDNNLNHFVLCSTHPSPLSAHNNRSKYHSFFGSHQFSKANQFLISCGTSAIKWEKLK